MSRLLDSALDAERRQAIAAWEPPAPADEISKLRELLHETQRLAALQRQEIAILKGERHTPNPGGHIARLICGAAYVQVEYDYEPEEAPVLDLDSPMCGPGCGELIAPHSIYLNGHWCDLEDVRAALDEDKLVEAISEQRAQEWERERAIAYGETE